MNKGFLMFSQDDGLTMLKDEEPEDLTHLAPTAGDACIPLEDSPFDMFDDFILGDNYCSLLGEDLANNSPVDSLTADSLLMSSPEPQENESSCEQSSLLTELSLDAFDSGRSDNDIDDGHSPFIPTSDELPVLEPAVMWGALPDSVSLARPQPTESQTASPAPALQRLLAAPPTGPPPQDLITNIYSDQGLIPNRSVPSWDTGMKRVMKQEEEPIAKRVKRSPSPALPASSSSVPSSSVLMNLLDIPQRVPQHIAHKLHPNYQIMLNTQTPTQPPLSTIPVPVINIIQAVPNNQIMRTITPNVSNINNPNIRTSLNNVTTLPMAPLIDNNAMAPLSLNIGSPMYSLPSSPNTPNYSPAMSPAQRVLSPYSTPQSLSPVGKYSPASRLLSPGGIIQGADPYLAGKMQPSPGFPLQHNNFLDSSMSLNSPDIWNESEVLSAFDDVKLG